MTADKIDAVYIEGFKAGYSQARFDLEQEPRWIPVSERLPEDHKDVLIYLSSDEICIGCYNSHRLPFSNNVIGWGASYAHNWCSNDVIAWMPLPKPYNPQESEE